MSAVLAELSRTYRPPIRSVEQPVPHPVRARRRALKPEIIPETTVNITPYPVSPSSATREILTQVYRVGVEAPSAQAGMNLVQKVRGDPHIKKIAFLGPPGMGKSTVIEQFVEELFAIADEEISVRITSFDPAFQRMIKYMPREFWESVHWKFINDSLLITSKMKKRERRCGRRVGPAREIELFEMPFVGSKDASDRGRSFIEKKWQELQETGMPNGMLFVPLVTTPRMVEKTKSFREEIAKAHTFSEKLAVLAAYGVEIAGETLKKAGKKAYEMIDTVIHKILQSANKKQLDAVAKDTKKAMREALPPLPPKFLEGFIPLPQEIKLSHDDAYSLRRTIFYWESELDRLGVPSHQRYILLNTPLPHVHRTPLQKSQR